MLLQEAQQKKKTEQEEAEQEKIRVEQVKEIGRKRFAEIFPEDAQAVIVARLRQNESDSYTDYYSYNTQRTVILGFSTHKRDIFSEMRKHASNFEQTAYLAEYNEKYEHRDLGGWVVRQHPHPGEVAHKRAHQRLHQQRSPGKAAELPDPSLAQAQRQYRQHRRTHRPAPGPAAGAG